MWKNRLRRIWLLFLVIWWSWLPYLVVAQSLAVTSAGSSSSLDALLQDYAYRAFGHHPKTGVVYDAMVPSNLTGIKTAALRLRNGSLRLRGVRSYKEFEIPPGVLVEPYVKRLVLVYQNLGNWSEFYYPLSGYTYLAPVLGLLAYDGSNVSAASDSPELLDIRASLKPISIQFVDVKTIPDGVAAKCVMFDLHGSINFSKVSSSSNNTCFAFGQGHFALVVEVTAAPSPAPVSPSPSIGKKKEHGKKKFSKAWVIVVGIVGGLLLVVLLGLMICCLKHRNKKHIEGMVRAAENGETLQMTPVGSRLRVPAATRTRTHPSSVSFMTDSSSGGSLGVAWGTSRG
ncbi:hypothetical protein Droror1_Dr00006524 [Drosera rotundifolia]